MSAPDTNIKKQERRHAPALSGITIALLASGVIMIAVALFVGVPWNEQAAPNATTPPATAETK